MCTVAIQCFSAVSKTPSKTLLVLYVLCLMKPDKVNLNNLTLTIYTGILCRRKTSRAKILIKLVWMFILRPERKAIWNFPQKTSPMLLIYLTVHHRRVFISKNCWDWTHKCTWIESNKCQSTYCIFHCFCLFVYQGFR